MSNLHPAFLEDMAKAGIVPAEPINTIYGKITRFRAKGDKTGKQDAWLIYRPLPFPHGWYGHWRLGVHIRWQFTDSIAQLSPEEQQTLNTAMLEMEEKVQFEIACKQAAAAYGAEEIWNAASKADPTHQYLIDKGLPPFGIRQRDTALIVPMLDSSRKLCNLQRIYPDGEKRFLSGGKTKGAFWWYGIVTPGGMPTNGPVLIGEGYATMAVCRVVTGHGVVAALSAKNLPLVAVVMRSMFPARELVIVADDDSHLAVNIGMEAAKEAAASVGASLVVPRKGAAAEGSATQNDQIKGGSHD